MCHLVGVIRKAVADVVLRDGTVLPQGVLVTAPRAAVHFDEANYKNAQEFDLFRFARMRELDGESSRHQFVSTSTEYIPFGHGKHAWYVFLCFPPLEPHVHVDIALVVSLLPTS